LTTYARAFTGNDLLVRRPAISVRLPRDRNLGHDAYLTGALLLGGPDYVQIAHDLVGLFALRPLAGVNVRLARGGSWFALYTFAPAAHVLNAQLNAVVALHEVAAATHDTTATARARDGQRAARRHIARFDTGCWSRYAEHGPLADLNYHALNRDLARTLCKRTNERAICNAWHLFSAELERRCPRVPGSSRVGSRQFGRPTHRP
jgi:hypothetical protein